MAFVPVRLSQRLILGCIVLLILTALAVFAVMAMRGQPRLVAASGELIEQTGSAITRGFSAGYRVGETPHGQGAGYRAPQNPQCIFINAESLPSVSSASAK